MYSEVIIPKEKYFEDLLSLCKKIIDNNVDIDAIVAIKRSGFIMGAVISNYLEKPLYTTSEIENIPNKFKNILLVDDKICSGKTIRRFSYKLISHEKNVTTASLYIEKEYYSDFWCLETSKTVSMWYEKLK
jgi:hypoxanthine phosphoribosyltransferase